MESSAFSGALATYKGAFCVLDSPRPVFPCLASSAIMDLLNVTTMWVQARPLVEQAVTTLLNEPLHLIVEACLVIFVFVLIFKSSYVIPKGAVSPLSEAVRLTPNATP